MTAKKFFGLVVIACLISVLVSAEVKNEKQVEPARRAAGATASRQRKVSPDREKAYQEMLAKRMTPNKQTITDLEEVKKIAEEEGAVRTIEAIQKMIEKKQAEVKELTDRFDRQRRERSERMKQRTQVQAGKKNAEQKKSDAPKE